MLLPLAIVGAWRVRRPLVGQLATIMILLVWAFHALVYSELRYNYSVLTLIIILAGIGAATLAALASGRTGKVPATAQFNRDKKDVVVKRAQRRA